MPTVANLYLPAPQSLPSWPARFPLLAGSQSSRMKLKRPPTSERRAAASRANSAKSSGPVTARGKHNSSLNSTRHGILAHFLVMSGEMPALFQEQYDEFMDEHQPRTPTERALVEEMATSWWRKQRVWGMESARIQYQVRMNKAMGRLVEITDPATETAIAVGDLAGNGRCLDLFLRYETRYERQFHRALARLIDLKSRDPEPDTDSDADAGPDLAEPEVGRAPSPAADAPAGFPPSPNEPPNLRDNSKISPRSSEDTENERPLPRVQGVQAIPVLARVLTFAAALCVLLFSAALQAGQPAPRKDGESGTPSRFPTSAGRTPRPTRRRHRTSKATSLKQPSRTASASPLPPAANKSQSPPPETQNTRPAAGRIPTSRPRAYTAE